MREREKEKEIETLIWCSTCLCIHGCFLILVCALMGN